ncbi:Tektin-3, putative [Pediculus humanus corporis]|uniref:Tektin n=1 Tax=Pediculus humanus subsp. corporis TaxID=121224 RepID=E0VLR6_PEDHC|nr:Tektin-3, putative [Pediculus humanus corporis]EEB14322.1 Tektin-3, putative [Pediculus humanus corporis]
MQNWSTVGVEPCMEQTMGPGVPPRVGQFHQTPKNHPWRPTLGYENVEVTPLPMQPVTNSLLDTCYTPTGMATEPLRFPNLVTGFDRNPANAARAALYTRYTPYEWTQNNISQYNEADSNRNFSEKARADACRVMREADELANSAQREVGRRIGERINDLTFWTSELQNELEKMVQESKLLQDSRRVLEKTIQDLEAPLHIAQECLYHRENRTGVDLVHDEVEQSLLREINLIKKCQAELHCLFKKLKDQLRNNRASQHELERDLRMKEQAMGIDNLAHSLNNFSRGINYYGGIENYDNTITTPETWIEFSNQNIQKSQAERAKSAQIRTDTDNIINAHANDCWNAWTSTNAALERRANEMLDAKQKLQMHLHKIQREIFDVEKNIEMLRKSIQDKSLPLKVAQTRLEARAHRQEIELCRDPAQNRLVIEIKDIQDSIEKLHLKLQEAEAQHQQLLKTRSNLESELANKVNSLFIDREKCLGMRRSYPITATIKY